MSRARQRMIEIKRESLIWTKREREKERERVYLTWKTEIGTTAERQGKRVSKRRFRMFNLGYGTTKYVSDRDRLSG